MTVPEGAPKNVEWADRMRQALQIAGSNVGSLEDLFPKGHDKIGVRFNDVKNALSKLDEIADEIATFEMLKAEQERDALSLRELALLETLTAIQDYCGYHFRDDEPAYEPMNIARRAIIRNEEARAVLEVK